MAMRVDPTLLDDMERYGAPDVKACFNCGNCTAVCPLSEGDDAFPRRMIRYVQLGQRDKLAACKEVWTCYYCGECSETCPREAAPGELMAAARRFSIGRFDPTTLSRRMFTSSAFNIGWMIVLFGILVGFLLGTSETLPEGRVNTASLLEWIPFDIIHDLGLAVIIILAVLSVVALVNMVWLLARETSAQGAPRPPQDPSRFPLKSALLALGDMIGEAIAHRRFRDCQTEQSRDDGPLPLRRRWVHMSIMFGFLGLALATVLDYFLKEPGSYVPIYYPIRLLGTVAGIALMYGTTVAMIQRARKPDRAYFDRSTVSDWALLIFLWIIGATGFVLEIGEYVTLSGIAVDIVFLVHVGLAMELLLLLPFTKFAHIIYRPVALWFFAFRARRMGVVPSNMGLNKYEEEKAA